MAKILVTVTNFAQRCPRAMELLKTSGNELVVTNAKLREMEKSGVYDMIHDIDAVIIGMDPWNGPMFDMAKNLKAAVKFGVGVDNIDLEEAKKRGIYALNTAGANAEAVAEATIGVMIALLRNITGIHNDLTQRHQWTRFLGGEIKGKTVGLIGFGQIGRRVCQLANAFGARVIAYKRTPDASLAEKYDVTFMALNDVLAKSDILSLHIPAAADNFHMINDDTIAMMKDGAYIVNFGRGALIDEAALARALADGKIAGAGLDVYGKEPPEADNPLLSDERVICLPHTGGETAEAYENVGMMAAEEVLTVLAGREPGNWVNKWKK